MKFRILYKYLIIFLIPLSIIQPVKADLASDLLEKAQKLFITLFITLKVILKRNLKGTQKILTKDIDLCMFL